VSVRSRRARVAGCASAGSGRTQVALRRARALPSGTWNVGQGHASTSGSERRTVARYRSEQQWLATRWSNNRKPTCVP